MMSKIAVAQGLSRRAMLGAAGFMIAAPALAEGCRVGPPPHAKGPVVFDGLDQVELDAAYDQTFYAPTETEIIKRVIANSAAARARLGEPMRLAYGKSEIEKLDVFRTKQPKAPIFVFIHGGAWLRGSAKGYAYAAEAMIKGGANLVIPDFINVKDAGGDLTVMANQVRSAVAWAYKNAEKFGGDPDRFYIGGHSSGGHLCGVCLTTDWQKDFGLAPTFIKGGVCMSGMYDMKPVRLSKRGQYVHFTDAMEDAMSSQRHIDKLVAPIVVTYGTDETPEFQRQNRDFAAAVKKAGKSVQLIESPHYNHFEMMESLGNPYGPNGRAALEIMKLST